MPLLMQSSQKASKAKMLYHMLCITSSSSNVILTAIHVFKSQCLQDFGGKGFWTLRYTDSNLRVLDTNQDHVFVLERVHDPKLQF